MTSPTPTESVSSSEGMEGNTHRWWIAVASLAGDHGVRYRTNRGLNDFLAGVAALSALRAEEGSEIGLPPVPAQAAERLPVVKALEWVDILTSRSAEEPLTEVGGFEAATGFSQPYVIVIDGDAFEVEHDYITLDVVYSEREAKAVAQADFERRIHSALTPAEGAGTLAAADQSRPSSDEERIREDEQDMLLSWIVTGRRRGKPDSEILTALEAGLRNRGAVDHATRTALRSGGSNE